jgi:hypothetical protein
MAAANRPGVGECEAVPEAGQAGPQLGQAARRAPVASTSDDSAAGARTPAHPASVRDLQDLEPGHDVAFPQGTSDRVGSDRQQGALDPV